MRKGFSRRELLRSTVIMGGLGVGSIVLEACGSAGPSATPTPAAGLGKTYTFTLDAGNTVAFSQQKLTAEAGSKITVTFTNKSTDKQYNWVLSQPGKMLRVVTDGQSQGSSSGYVVPNDPNVIAHTKLLKPGESDTITFNAPPPGSYPFFCTYPGFYTRLNGTLIIT